MTKDLLRNTAVARALIILMTNPAYDPGNPHVRVGFDSIVNALSEGVERSSQAERSRQVDILGLMRAHAADIFDARDRDTQKNAMASLAADFDTFAAIMPGYDMSDGPDGKPAGLSPNVDGERQRIPDDVTVQTRETGPDVPPWDV